MDSLVTKTKRKDVRKALKVLPPGLDESYDRTMERIENQPKEFSELGKGVSMWVGMAYHLLSPSGIQHALAVDADMTEICDDDLDDADTLLAACAGLVVLDIGTGTLRFVRKSLRSATSCCTRISFVMIFPVRLISTLYENDHSHPWQPPVYAPP